MASPNTGNALTPLSNLVSPHRAFQLATSHILSVFSVAPSESNAKFLADTYTDIYASDITIYENDGGVVTGHEGVRDLVTKLIGKGGPFEGWRFTVTGEVKLNRDFVWVTWGFGPSKADQGRDAGIEVKMTGADGILLEKGKDGVVRITTAYVIIDGASDARGI
jgi:hypothetical protein